MLGLDAGCALGWWVEGDDWASADEVHRCQRRCEAITVHVHVAARSKECSGQIWLKGISGK